MQRVLLLMALIGAAGASVAQTPDKATIAQKRIEADGYKHVHDVALGEDGLWHARAKRDSTEVEVTVDRHGNVTQD
jgi:hypothetical protein